MKTNRIKPLYVLLLLAFIMGCSSPNSEFIPQQPDPNQIQIQQLTEQLNTCQRENSRLNDRLEASTMANHPLDEWVHITDIAFGQYTRGLDENKDGIDEGVRIYLVVRDQDGDRIKFSGSLDIELWNLATDPPTAILKRSFEPAQLRQHWMGGLLADHYLIDLPWDKEPTDVDILTVKCRLHEFLTAKTHEIQRAIEINQ